MSALFGALVGFASLGADWALVQCSKAALQTAADAAARAGALGLFTSATQAKADATTLAAANICAGTPVVLTSADIEIGTWNSSNRTFTIGGSSPNAVRVNAQRTAARGTAVPLAFAGIFGQTTCDIHASAITIIIPNPFGVVGLSSISMSGNASDSYWSSNGSAPGNNCGIASNGNIILSGNASVSGNARPGIGKSVSGGTVTGSTAPLTTALTYPNGSAGSYATTNDNAKIAAYLSGPSADLNLSGGASLSLPGGTYYIHDFNISGSASLTFTGPTTIYCWHNFTMSGSSATTQNLPGSLTVTMCPSAGGASPGPVDISGSAALYANVYAPQSDITVTGSSDIYGTVLGQTISMTGNSTIHYNASFNGANRISVVK